MSNPVTGLVQVTGEHDVGKSIFCLSCKVMPQHIVFIDDDVKGRAIVNQVGINNFALYVDLVKECKSKTDVQQHEVVLSIIDRIEKLKDIEAIVWDTWTRAGKSCLPYVKKYPNKFKEKYAPMGAIKGAEEAGAGNLYEAELLGRLCQVSPLVFATTHLKEQFKNLSDNRRVATGKMEPDARKMLEEKANFRVWLKRNPNGTPIPIGLALKRPPKMELGNDGFVPINFLPRRINPCTWEKIIEYWNNPVGDREPLPDEMPDAFELSILDGTLTADQRMVYQAALKAVESEPAETVFAPTPSVFSLDGSEELSEPERLRRAKQNGGT